MIRNLRTADSIINSQCTKIKCKVLHIFIQIVSHFTIVSLQKLLRLLLTNNQTNKSRIFHLYINRVSRRMLHLYAVKVLGSEIKRVSIRVQ